MKGLAARSEGSRPATACCFPDPRGAPCQPSDRRCVRFEKFFASSLKYHCGQSGHRIAAAVGISRYTVAEYLRRAAVVGITWPVPPELDDATLERKLFTPPGAMATEPVRPQPDWVRLHAEMRRPGVTLLLLWEEYRAGQPEGYGYSRYVAAILMLRLVTRARPTAGNPGCLGQ
jgi:hypothetical protein